MSILKRIYGAGRNNWRIVLLTVLILLSTYFLFVPGATIGDDGGGFATDGEVERMTNLQFGIDLAGGSRVIAPVHGVHVTDVQFDSPEHRDEIEESVSAQLNLSEIDIHANLEEGTLEVFDPEVTSDQLRDALITAGLSDDDFSGPNQGVTSSTRSDIISVLNERLDAAGFAGGSVTDQRAGDQSFIVAEWPGSRERLLAVMADRGAVEVVVHSPHNDSWQETTVLDGQQHIDSVSSVRQSDTGGWDAPVTITSDHAQTFVDRMLDAGFDDPEASTTNVGCDYPNEDQPQERPDDGWGYCLLVIQDGDILSGYGVAENLRTSFVDSSFADDPRFVINTIERDDAEQVRINLLEGALAAEINVAEHTGMDISPALAERFLQNSLLTGLVAILAVVTMVFLRYGDPRVAAPMSITALSELYLLLGFSAAIGYSLDLAIMAGFIAVVGTGVDDLIIIADEVMGQHDVRSQRVFDSRFRKAFWVIGAAAATTIVAMSPLAVMELGDLRGFAIVTILGVLIGVFLTRPAYGNILRLIKTDK